MAEAPAVQLAQALIEDAARLGASDIHLGQKRALCASATASTAYCARRVACARHWPHLLVRLKVMGGLNILPSNARPQEWPVVHAVAGRTLDIRVACLPTLHGENLSLRLFDRARGLPTLASLTTATQHAQLTRMLARLKACCWSPAPLAPQNHHAVRPCWRI